MTCVLVMFGTFESLGILIFRREIEIQPMLCMCCIIDPIAIVLLDPTLIFSRLPVMFRQDFPPSCGE